MAVTGNRTWLAEGLVEHDGTSWRLVGSECRTCGQRAFPSIELCPACLSRDLHRVQLSTTGRVYSLTRVERAPPGFVAPYHLTWVDLDDGVRVFGQLLVDPETTVGIGATVEVTTAPLRHDADGSDVWGHAFQPTGARDG